jgi:hypothetical protein
MSQPFRIKNDFEVVGNLTAEGGAVFGAVLDPDAAAYIQAVEAADGQSLEGAVRLAYAEFVVGCKSDGIWDAIKASCIMAGARTLGGALVPLRGTAPTNFNFVSSDYNRKTGLIGDGATKYLDSNRAGNADPQNNQAIAVNVSAIPPTTSGALIGYGTGVAESTHIAPLNADFRTRSRSNESLIVRSGTMTTGFAGLSRSTSATYQVRIGGTTYTETRNSIAPASGTKYFVFGRQGPISFTDARLSFYSIGEAIDLAALDTRVSALMTALNTAII